MIHWVFLLFFLSSSAQAGNIPMPVTCRAEASAGQYGSGQPYWQRTDPDNGTIWRVGPGSAGWSFGNYQGIKRLPGWIWYYSSAPVPRKSSLTNCEVTRLVNGLRSKLWVPNQGIISNPSPPIK